VAGRLVGARGARLPLVLGGVGTALGALMLTGLSARTSSGWLLTSYVIFGIGVAMVNPPITNTAVSGMPAAQAGVAAATTSTSRQVGQSLGVAVVGSVVASRIVGPLETGFAAASHPGWWIIVACGLVVILLAVVTTGAWARSTAAQVAADPAAAPDRRTVVSG
jgi:MFS family permease